MTAKATKRFWQCYAAQPHDVQARARKQFAIWRRDPFHQSLQFKLISGDMWSVRVTLDYRALARRKGDLIAWFWIGTHAEYNGLVGGNS